MQVQALALVGGIAAFQFMPSVPPALTYTLALPASAALLLARRRSWRAGAALCAGFLWAMWRADVILAERLPVALNGAVIRVAGSVDDVALAARGARAFTLAATSAVDLRGRDIPLRRLRLVAYEPVPGLFAGAHCHVTVRARIPYGIRSPGAFDRERWLYSRGISATGYVITHYRNACTPSPAATSLAGLRARIAAAIADAVPDPAHAAVIAALAVAIRDGLSDEQRSVLRDTGTAHLLAISGLHISFVAGAAFFLAHWVLGALSPTHRRWPVQDPAAFIAIAAALAYAALAGFPVSTQRALVMLVVVLVRGLCRVPVFSPDSLLSALVAVAILDPSALLSAATWLSFLAVSWLLLINRLSGSLSALRRALRMHAILALGMTPLLGVLHQSIPLVSPLANLIVVPVVTLVIVPCVVAGVGTLGVSPVVAGYFWRIAATVWDHVFALLSGLAEAVPPLALGGAPNAVAMFLAFAGVLVLVVPVVQTRAVLAAVLLLGLGLSPYERPPPGAVEVAILDVGQGLAAVVRTATKVLVYDTGPAHGEYSAAAAVIVPYLRHYGVARIDRLIVSHGDNDHAGGVAALRKAVPVGEVWANPQHRDLRADRRCSAGQRWRWDRVEFEILHPLAPANGSRNDASCVLKISAPGGRILLPGDIEANAEGALLARAPDALAADVLVAPHHGSTTSSSPRFVAAVAPRFVVFATGFANRFGLPAAATVRTYDRPGVRTLTTATAGTIEFRIDTHVRPPRTYRREAARYWHHTAP